CMQQAEMLQKSKWQVWKTAVALLLLPKVFYCFTLGNMGTFAPLGQEDDSCFQIFVKLMACAS
ncbi:MAG: hypothetical protein R3261_14135, partial [Alphaproteobacteria bacterium]|nr:hypothetical protein [Alphaproteobacteria bacterium]